MSEFPTLEKCVQNSAGRPSDNLKYKKELGRVRKYCLSGEERRDIVRRNFSILMGWGGGLENSLIIVFSQTKNKEFTRFRLKLLRGYIQ